jgi:hypothetical protein
MSRTKALCIGLLTFWPFAFLVIYAAVFSLFLDPATVPALHPRLSMLIFTLFLLTVGDVFVLPIYFFVHLYKNTVAIPREKSVWAVLFLITNFAFMGPYWYYYMWKPSAREEIPALP